MGKIEFYGTTSNYHEIAEQELAQIKIPDNANIITNNVENNTKNQLLFTLPIIIIIMLIVIIKQIKNGFLNKKIRKEIQDENIKKHNLDTPKKKIRFALRNFFKIYIIALIIICSSTTVHEYLHAIPGAMMGYNMKVAIDFPFGGGSTWMIEDLTKIENIIFTITPVTILGFIPALIAVLIRVNKKNYLVSWCLALFSIMMIYSASSDIVGTYNLIKNVPNGAYTGESNGIYYWYKK